MDQDPQLRVRRAGGPDLRVIEASQRSCPGQHRGGCPGAAPLCGTVYGAVSVAVGFLLTESAVKLIGPQNAPAQSEWALR
jgi:hypothetical protein